MALITCRDAAFAYEGITVVWDITFEVESGDYVCIVGENGSGKSTLLKGLLRLKSPVRGSVLNGDGLKARDIGYLPQHTAARMDFPAGVYEVVLSGRLSTRGLKPFYGRADRAAAEENMERLGVAELRNTCYRELSGGQQQRVLLARALCAAGKMLCLDEPAAGLDPVVSQNLYGLLEKINRETGLAIVMVSHDIPAALKYAKHILHIKNTQVFFGAPEDYPDSRAGNTFLGRTECIVH
jgi:zinc transport system ATP-binding protein